MQLTQEEIEYYESVLPGWHAGLSPSFLKLAQLLSQDQFELIEKEDELWLVYLMNDAVESFLIFEEGRLTGTYLEGFDGPLFGSLKQMDDRYGLIVNQGEESVFTVFFKDLTLFADCFNYGNVGHFWVEGYEYLRQIEFRLAILADKAEYLGTEWTTKEEMRLAALRYFPPLNAVSYPAVPAKYLELSDALYFPADASIDVMEELCEEAGDWHYKAVLSLYRRYPIDLLRKYLAWMLHRKRHASLVDCLERQLKEAAGVYPPRCFSKEIEKEKQELILLANEKIRELGDAKEACTVYLEEPFLHARDSIDLHAWVLVWKECAGNRTCQLLKVTK